MKTVLFIPGNKEDITSRDYSKTIKAIEERGYKVIFVSITWRYHVPDQWLSEFNKTYDQYDAKDVVIAGFSFGAVVALMAAAKRNPSALWLFSLSPYFAEDFPLPKSWYKWHGTKAIQNFKNIKFSELSKNINCPALSFVGEREAKKYPSLRKRALAVANQITKAKFILVANASHDVTDDDYVFAIKSNI